MKKYLLSSLFIFMFAFIYQLGVSQAHEPVDGECATWTPFVLQNSGDNHPYPSKTQTKPLCESGSFVLISRFNSGEVLNYACSGAFGGKSIQCEWRRTYAENNR